MDKNIETVDLSELIKDLQVKDFQAFGKYLIEIWRDLARRSQDPSKGIEKLTFSHYYDLPGIINDRLFKVFDKSGNNHIDPKEFIEGMSVLFTESFKELANFIFKFYDFDKDGFITREDVRVVLSYVPLQKKITHGKMKYEQVDFKDREESQGELVQILNTAFGSKEKLNQDEFIHVIDNVSSDIFIYILMFLLEKRPFKDESISLFPKSPQQQCQTPKTQKSHKIASPSLKSKFVSPTLKKRAIELGGKGALLGMYAGKGGAGGAAGGAGGKPAMDPRLMPGGIGGGAPTEKKGLNFNVKGPRRHTKINLAELDDVGRGKSTFSVTNKPAGGNIPDEDDDDNTSQQLITHEGYMYKVTESKKLKKVYFKLIGLDFYYYKDKPDPETPHKGLHNLSGVHVKAESGMAKMEGKDYYAFTILFPKKNRTYYVEDKKEFDMWMSKLKASMDYRSLTDEYNITEKAGKGKFGLVKIGTHKESGRTVAIKIMKKTNMTNEDLELAKTEIDIMKMCQHPNIIKLYDVNETSDYIYIIMEYCSGGDLFSYIEKRGYKLQEPRAAEIVYKLSQTIYYIHSFGIVHRDLKPENILMTNQNDDADIRLLDFGLSKITGPKEKCTEPYGTLSYVAPEVLNEKPYGKEVDLWSIGIIAYLLLCGFLPFDDENSEREIARQTIEDPVPYPNQIWGKLSKESKSFVNSLLKKNPAERMPIEQVLEHEWFQKFKLVSQSKLSPKKARDNLFSLYAGGE